MSDTLAIIVWWLTFFLIGLIFLPITSRIFHKFVDRGYIFSKVLGLLFSSYIMWLIGSFHLIPFNRTAIIIIFLGLALVNLWLLNYRIKDGIIIKLAWGWMIFEEMLFGAGLTFWSYVRATEPSIRGLEKFMDFGFVNSILRSTYFPPLDMWLTKSPDYTGGFFINYYYFGHYITAFLTKLSGLDSIITYNLMMATLFAFTFTLAFSLGINILTLSLNKIHGNSKNLLAQKPTNRLQLIIVGLITAFIVAFGGNLHTIYNFTSGYPNENPQPPWQIENCFQLKYLFPPWNLINCVHPERYWYPNATRFIPFTIHEFPIYSFVVADLHGHVSDIPFVFLTLALLLSLIHHKDSLINDLGNLGNLSKKLEKTTSFLHNFEQHTSIPFFYIALLGVLLAVMYMTNAWDGLIYMILTDLVFLYINLTNSRSGFKGVKKLILSVFYKTFSAALFLLFFFLIANLPFSLNFRPFVSGIGVLCAPAGLLDKTLGPLLFEAGKCQKSAWWMLLFLWGFFYFNVIGYLIFVVIPAVRKKWGVGDGKRYHASHFGNQASHFSLLTSIDIFILLLILISTLLLIFPEFFYVKDIYPAHYRANTMFKLGYQAFMMLGLVSSYAIFRIKFQYSHTKRSVGLKIYNIFFIALFSLVAIYPYFAITSYYGGLKRYKGLYGLNWMSQEANYSDDQKAIEWLRNNIDGQPVILEANGESYTDYARVSAYTGLPTVIGWPVHEWLWRGSYDEAGKRIPEVATIYESKDLSQTKVLLRKYNVEYIFLGALEKEKYKDFNEEKIGELGKIVFQSGKTKIYKVNFYAL